MALDPIAGLDTLEEGNPLGYLHQNDWNLVLAFFAMAPVIETDAATDPTAIGTVARGQAWIIGSGGGASSTLWDGYSAGTIAIALSADPLSVSGWYFFTPQTGTRVWIVGGSATGHAVWNGSAFVAV